jgi:hypothetical protein
MNIQPHQQKHLEQIKENCRSSPIELIENLAKSKTEWVKDFVESQKPKPKVETVADLYKKIKFQESILNKTK